MNNLNLISPEIILFACGLFVLVLSAFLNEKYRRLVFYIPMVALVYVLIESNAGILDYKAGFGSLWIVDLVSNYFRIIIIIASILTLMMSVNYSAISSKQTGAYVSLVMFASSAMMLVTSAFDLVYLFLSLEIMSISCFVLTGFDRQNSASNEGAIKYFLIGGISAAIMVYGISLFYGATGTTNLFNYGAAWKFYAGDNLYVLGILFIIAGLGFKISIVPFHFWAPDAYQGAPTPITAYLSTASKLAAISVFMRIFTDLIQHHSLGLNVLMSALAVLTMTVGNLMALFQNNIKRLLAYSSIAHAGYILIGITVGDSLAREGILIYSLAYLFTNMGIFAGAILVARRTGTYELEGFNGLAKKSLSLSLIIAVFLLSLIGIPPLAGFIGKFYVFASAINAPEYAWLAVVGIINSLISVYYYMKIAHKMFFVEPDFGEMRGSDGRNSGAAAPGAGGYADGHTTVVLIIAAVFTVLIGIFPQSFFEVIQSCIAFEF
ncbi:MAG: NADH-quinone oxidoreductase subunit N [Elusimicrobia bacterium]|nr:NADH-quinone oxidoreductase subunit N [Elusimicrobiota bacterium]